MFMSIVNYVVLYVLMKSVCKLPQDDENVETCMTQVTEKMHRCRIVHLLVFQKF
jgi:hypothetical protein